MTADIWQELAPGVLAETLASDLRDLAWAYEHSRDRNRQTTEHILGPSQIGSPCARCLARAVLQRPLKRDFDDPWLRLVGVGMHGLLEEAALVVNMQLNRGRYHIERRVYPDGEGSELLPKGGNADLYDEDTHTVIDHKVVGLPKIKKVREHGPGEMYRRQGHLYGRGYQLLGYPVQNVAIAFWNRNGFLRDLHVWTEPYDEAVAVEALNRYRDIRTLALAVGVQVLPILPADPDCWSCRGADVDPEELA